MPNSKFFDYSKVSIEKIIFSKNFQIQNESYQNDDEKSLNSINSKSNFHYFIFIPSIVFVVILIWIIYLLILNTKRIRPRIKERITSV
jgi:hypothetical protein